MWKTSASRATLISLAVLVAAVGLWNLAAHELLAGVAFLLMALVYLLYAASRARRNSRPGRTTKHQGP
ncbi:hypothetical protein OF385_14445 [Glutamicibacter sp. JL.03c]|uniref:hypothetical protein n=1 Tax=Glutamicibacter sp. JL.03c TaxID=2984842 RepID=UPI0021F7C816|nr:hypothetical protein [Glutamicibacter sp. JL.03c]UYQ77204.1 hypothetical protein OF385_14445 [Glutamicibacter sp. JL.03c]